LSIFRGLRISPAPKPRIQEEQGWALTSQEEGRKNGRKEGRKDGRKEGRKDGRKEGRKDV
jgi:flagellar biosynthesis/type III secretory pathway protein FliH